MTRPTLLAVDGNSLLHRNYHAMEHSQLSTSDGRPLWAVKGFLSQLFAAIERADASAVVVGFDDHTSSVRKEGHPQYKANRSPKAPELGQQIASTIELLRAAGVPVVIPAGLEADDVLASAAAYAPTVGWRTVVVTSDRDSFALIDEHTDVLRVLNGGIEGSPILTPERLFSMVGVRPSQYQEYAAMRGDPSDNLLGIPGLGEKRAAKLLRTFGSVSAAFSDSDSGGSLVGKRLGKSFVATLSSPATRDVFWRNVAIMTMRRDLPLGLDLSETGASRLPLDAVLVLAALESFELHSLRNSARRVLCVSGPTSPADFRGQPQPEDDVPLPPLEEPLWSRDRDQGPAGTPATAPATVAATKAPTGTLSASVDPEDDHFDETLW
ncbi:5'-3' exonuclease H3TH domain-containing protein [Pengzhenrongella phosphoraccumulans]|uniref:5'-3' exonuclease n=1 Tax=Pengzhenrongella phosphoraccumulans TaxID=3114394 RepID=UPI00388E7269